MILDNIPVRHWADKRDISLPIDTGYTGYMPDSEAIGGYYGISWYAYFKDRNSGEVYKVLCTDGVYGGRGPYNTKREERKVKEKQYSNPKWLPKMADLFNKGV